MPLPRRHTPGEPNPHPFPDTAAPPRPAPSRTATSSQPPSDPPPVLPDEPAPLPHRALALPRGRRTRPCPCSGIPPPSPGPPPLSVEGALGLGGPARCSRAPPLPWRGEGRSGSSGSAGPAPSSRMPSAAGAEGAGPSVQRWGGAGWVWRCPEKYFDLGSCGFLSTRPGVSALIGRSTQEGEKGPSGSERVGLELGTAPSGMTPLLLTGSPRPTCKPPTPSTHTHTDCLNASTACFGFQKPLFHSPPWELGVGSFSGNPPGDKRGCLPRNTQNHDTDQAVCGQGPCCSPPPPEGPCHSRALPAAAPPQAHSPLCHPSSSVPTVIVFSGRN